MGFIHSKLRNALTLERVEKLVYIRCNARQPLRVAGGAWISGS
jgi:hypothetical protein